MIKRLDISTYIMLFGLLGATLLYDIGFSGALSIVVFLATLAVSIAMFVVGVRKEHEEFDLFGDENIVYAETFTSSPLPANQMTDSYSVPDRYNADEASTSNLTESDMELFSNEMNSINENLKTIELAMQKSDTVNNIMKEGDRWLALGIFRESLAKSPERLTDISNFAYTNLPDLAKLVKLYVLFEEEEIVDGNMMEALDESVIAIGRLADLLVENYIDFREKELNELKSHVNNVNQLVDKHERLNRGK